MFYILWVVTKGGKIRIEGLLGHFSGTLCIDIGVLAGELTIAFIDRHHQTNIIPEISIQHLSATCTLIGLQNLA
jgi:hypothetical protein